MPATPIYFFHFFERTYVLLTVIWIREQSCHTPYHTPYSGRKCKKRVETRRKEPRLKGYNTPNGYMGFVDGRYLLFCTEGDYLDYVRDMLGELAIEPVIEARQAA